MEDAVTISAGRDSNAVNEYLDDIQTLEEYILPEDGFFNIVSFENDYSEEEKGQKRKSRTFSFAMNKLSLSNGGVGINNNMISDNEVLVNKNGVVKRKAPPKPPRRSRSYSSTSGMSSQSDGSSSQHLDG